MRKLICVSRESGALARLRHGQFPRLWSWRLRQPRRRGERLLEAGRIQPGYVDSAAKEDSEQPGGPPASHRVLRGVENGGNPTETARDATKNASGSGDRTSVVAVGRATFGHLRPPSASRNSRVPAVDALPALLSCQMPAHAGYTAPVFAKTRMVCVLLHSRNVAY